MDRDYALPETKKCPVCHSADGFNVKLRVSEDWTVFEDGGVSLESNDGVEVESVSCKACGVELKAIKPLMKWLRQNLFA